MAEEISWQSKIEEEGKLRGYSIKTTQSYIHQVNLFLKSGKTPRQYLLGLIENKKADGTVRSAGFAIKFYLKLIYKENRNVKEILNRIPNLKKGNKLPEILSKGEIERMIDSTKNLNHRLIIELAYSSGLRLSEIINLRWKDIDFERNLIHLKNAKGKKDRIVMLSDRVKQNLQHLELKKEGHVFKTNRSKKYTGRTIQMLVKNAAKKAGIKKKVSPHSLRHAFATHLLEKGIDIRYIKDLLGHANISTTLIYTKVSNRDISKIKSPLD